MTAKALSSYVVQCFNKHGHPLTNLKLQTVLYFLWLDYYRETSKALYDDALHAWPLGPIIPSVYYAYCGYMGDPIRPLHAHETEARSSLDRLLEPYYQQSVYALVEASRGAGSPWDGVFQQGAGFKARIPFEAMIRSLKP